MGEDRTSSFSSQFRRMGLLLAGGGVGLWLYSGDWMTGAAIVVGGLAGGGIMLGGLHWMERTSRDYDEQNRPDIDPSR